MPFVSDIIKSYLRYKLTSFIIGKKGYSSWKNKSYALRTAKIKNQELAKELEEACQKKGGFLTYSEYLEIEQFGKNGYHVNNSVFGKTEVHKNWAKTLSYLCRDKDYSHVIEFGPGEADLAINFLKRVKKFTHEVYWSAVEINPALCEKINKIFKKERLEKYLRIISPSIKNISFTKKSIILFPYSLDSIPPEVFVNTSFDKSFPDALIGITVKKGILNEVYLKSDLLKIKKISLKDGVYTDNRGNQFELRSWKLHKNQRAYIPVKSFSILLDFANRALPDSLFVIIDEFRQSSYPWETGNLCLPKNLSMGDKKRDCEDIEKYYQNAGENLFYYPTYLYTFFKFLHSLGFSSIKYDLEQKFAKEIIGEKWFEIKARYYTYAFICTEKKTMHSRVIKLDFSQQKLI